ncbi:5-(carboxyamino)imidazole ribonucleotide synthase [Nakamurella flava]|uniref:N5-carboxyaminoimidazole ribonucleotide synthase n=1 Tax=Nakamurella flava TaxID=2576308 RepID=A0A4V6CRU1_9ACTN|nr:5-(carboxyamino)imidazole ribonucleotide synthase [Nakamurella flava]TKV58885.1 5-(carboxyamino)imidazole ribonucleotide synthase [Nakamurella flava]
MDERTGMPQVGMVGGGQLARMTHQAAIPLGQTLRVLAIDPGESAALVTPDVMLGHHTDLDALREFAQTCDVVTFDHEHVPTGHLRTLVAEGHDVYPGPDALQYAQDKALMRRRLGELGAPVPAFAVVDVAAPTGDESDRAAAVARGVEDFAAAHGWPAVVKTARGGYDGRGVWVVQDAAQAGRLAAQLTSGDGPFATTAGSVVIESFVPLRRELAVMVARSPFGQAAVWPVVQTVQQDGICVEVIAPAPDLPSALSTAAERLALQIAQELDVVGVMAVELFETNGSDGPDGPPALLVNELAMRPHNSGHWTMDGSVTSQFEQHLRAVLDYPLGRTDAIAPFTVMGNVLGGPVGVGAGEGAFSEAVLSIDERLHHLAARFPEVKVHLYGKAFRPGRKLGHVNVIGADLPELRRRAQLAAHWLGSGVWLDGYSLEHGATGEDDAASPQVSVVVNGGGSR